MRLLAGRFAGPPADQVAALGSIADKTGATVQAFDAGYVASRRHLERALELADRAIERDEAIADDRSVELLLYAAGRRQIDRALEMGLKEEPHPVVVVVDGGDEEAAAAAVTERFEAALSFEGILGDEGTLTDFYDITQAERDTGVDLEALVLERVALLVIDK